MVFERDMWKVGKKVVSAVVGWDERKAGQLAYKMAYVKGVKGAAMKDMRMVGKKECESVIW